MHIIEISKPPAPPDADHEMMIQIELEPQQWARIATGEQLMLHINDDPALRIAICVKGAAHD